MCTQYKQSYVLLYISGFHIDKRFYRTTLLTEAICAGNRDLMHKLITKGNSYNNISNIISCNSTEILYLLIYHVFARTKDQVGELTLTVPVTTIDALGHFETG